MTINITNCKRVRLLWGEYLQDSTVAYPYISFDNGSSWMDVSDVVRNVRNGSASSDYQFSKSTDSSTKLTSMDISFGFTPIGIPQISKLEAVIDNTYGKFVKNDGDTKTSYYFAVGCINYDNVGYDELQENYTTTGLELAKDILRGKDHAYYSGKLKNETYSVPYISEIKKIDISDTYKYSVNVYINYPSFVKGLLIYVGTTPNNLKLRYITNVAQKLKIDTDANSTTSITLKHLFKLPTNSGYVRIDDEYIPYTSQTYNQGGQSYTLTTGIRQNPVVHKSGAKVYYCWKNSITGDYEYGLPPKYYALPNTNRMLQYINFNSQQLSDVTGNTTPAIVGEEEYSEYLSSYQYCFKFNGTNIIMTNKELSSLNSTGSIHFYTNLTSFKSTGNDPYIFHPKYGSSGLFCAISTANKKIYVGYAKYLTDAVKYTYYILFSHDDYRIPTLTENGMDSIGIAWEKDTDSNLIFYLSINSYVNISYKSKIYYTDFNPGNLTLGGIYRDGKIEDNSTYVGYFDDWRVYDINMAVTYSPYVEEYIGALKNKVLLTDNTTLVDTLSGDGKSILEPYCNLTNEFNAEFRSKYGLPKNGYIINVNTGTEQNPSFVKYIYLTGKNYQGEQSASWHIYTKSKIFADIDDELKKDTDIYNGVIKLTNDETNYDDNTGDTNHLYDYGYGDESTDTEINKKFTDAATILGAWTLKYTEDSTYTLYTPKIHTHINTQPVSLVDADSNVGSLVVSNSKTLIVTYIKKPTISPTSIKVKYSYSDTTHDSLTVQVLNKNVILSIDSNDTTGRTYTGTLENEPIIFNNYSIDDICSTIYDNWSVKAYIVGNTSTFFYTYPVFPTTLQIKYVLRSKDTDITNSSTTNSGKDTTGFSTPIIKSPSAIVSEMTLS
jgi:hypothetical protein